MNVLINVRISGWCLLCTDYRLVCGNLFPDVDCSSGVSRYLCCIRSVHFNTILSSYNSYCAHIKQNYILCSYKMNNFIFCLYGVYGKISKLNFRWMINSPLVTCCIQILISWTIRMICSNSIFQDMKGSIMTLSWWLVKDRLCSGKFVGAFLLLCWFW